MPKSKRLKTEKLSNCTLFAKKFMKSVNWYLK